MPGRILSTLTALAALAAFPSLGRGEAGPAAARVATPTGLAVTVREIPVVVVPARMSSMLGDEIGGGLQYEVVEPAGATWRGVVPGTRGQAGDLSPSLSCNPITSDVLLGFTVRAPGSAYLDAEVVVVPWLGQQWADPGDAPVRRRGAGPALAFREGGDAAMLWRAPTLLGERMLLRHADLTAAGEGRLWSFNDLGNPWTHLGILPLGADSQRIRTWLAPESGADLLHVVVSDAGTGLSIVLTLDVALLREGGNGTTGAAPVPVSWHAGDRLGDPQPHSAGDGTTHARPEGLARDAWRLLVDEREIFYWLEADRLLAYVPDVGSGGTLLQLPAPDSEMQAASLVLRAVRRLGGELRHGAASATQGARRTRR